MISTNDKDDAAPLLQGLRVLELATWVAAPVIGAILAEYGADVIHIEDPERGDSYRLPTQLWKKSAGSERVNPSWELHNRNKRSLALSLRKQEGREIFTRMAAEADVFITNLLPESQRRLHIDSTSLSALYPRLIHVSVTGWGSAGPESQSRAFDVTGFWAASGMMSLLGDREGAPTLVRPGMGDRMTGLAATTALGLALYSRERTGRGQAIEVSLMHSGMWAIGSDMQRAAMYGDPGAKHSRKDAAAPLLNCYQTRDGGWLVLVIADNDWPALCACIGLPDLAADARFNTPGKRSENSQALIRMLDEAFAQRDRADWETRLSAKRLTHAPALSAVEAANHPQALANGFFIEAQHDAVGSYRALAFPMRFVGAAPQFRSQAPGHGEHSEEILSELGFNAQAIARLHESGVVRLPNKREIKG